jgi:tetraacyldisaccharide 4'-kinase
LTLSIFIYRLLQIVAIPFLLVYFLARGVKERGYLRRFPERLGFLPPSFRQTADGAIWLHAVSVGEVLSAAPLVRRLREELPMARIFVSSTTLAGRAAAEQKLGGLADGVFYTPIDYCFAVRRVLRTLRPKAVVVLETEIWPNLYREAKRRGCALVVANGRISDRAAPRYLRLRRFFRAVLTLPDAILAQDAQNLERYLSLGVPRGRASVAGNLKYDFHPRDAAPPDAVRGLIERAHPKEIWIAASTTAPAREGDPDEDAVVVEAFRKLAPAHPELLLILAPRKPERFDSAAARLDQAGVPFLRRSALGSGGDLALPGVLLLDSIGELSSLFALADAVFMGGTLADRGGHNILEPAFFGCATVAGPHMENFREIARRFTEAGALVRIVDGAELADAVGALLDSPERRARIGGAARQLAENERGAAARIAAVIAGQYWSAIPRNLPATPTRAFLWLLSTLWLAGARADRLLSLARAKKLETPAISVGGLAVGGVGKTPFVLWLAQAIEDRGLRPAILTRGYRRKSRERISIFAAGETAPPHRTGDEAQFYLASGTGPVGIGANRYRAGRAIEARFQPGVFLLDDAFQHHRLERTLDIVLLDALDPFGGGALLPLGRLREPLDALGRAGIIVLTRVQSGQKIDAIEAVIRRYNPNAPIFTARVEPAGWIDAATGEPAVPPANATAFCGLGNPASFWRSLDELGLKPLSRKAFPDHHAYTAGELKALAVRGTGALLTTQKDLMNLPAGWQQVIAPARLLWLRIALKVDREVELLDILTTRLAQSYGAQR